MGEFDLSLISEFRSRPSFYDRSSPRFKDKLYNAHLWQEISNKLGFDVSILKDRILQLRNRYNLEKRRIEQLHEENPYNSYDSPWPLYDQLHFLADHIRARKSYKRMMTLNGGGMGIGPPDLSNSCSNNSNTTLRQGTDGLGHTSSFPNGLLAVKMEDHSEPTEEETESQNNDSENNAFDPDGLITETHSSTYQSVQQPQRSPQKQYKQKLHQTLQHPHRPSISIRRVDTLRSDFTECSSVTNNRKRKQQPPPPHLHLKNQYLPPIQNDIHTAAALVPLKRPCFTSREYKYNAFGSFITSSLLDLPPSIALELVEKFTSDIVGELMKNAEQDQHCKDLENFV